MTVCDLGLRSSVPRAIRRKHSERVGGSSSARVGRNNEGCVSCVRAGGLAGWPVGYPLAWVTARFRRAGPAHALECHMVSGSPSAHGLANNQCAGRVLHFMPLSAWMRYPPASLAYSQDKGGLVEGDAFQRVFIVDVLLAVLRKTGFCNAVLSAARRSH